MNVTPLSVTYQMQIFRSTYAAFARYAARYAALFLLKSAIAIAHLRVLMLPT